ncbi:MAG: VWA domain-containing protein [Candidatus Omnitrophica bacterium]|nr:VWA domain-containing protein [Candidatus Omnitrophota bacterium]
MLRNPSFRFLGFLMIAFFLTVSPAFAQSEIEIIFDGSRSMNDPIEGGTKLALAKQAMSTVAGQIQPGSRVGLRIFGTTSIQGNMLQSCEDSVLAMPIAPFRGDVMLEKVQGLQSFGMTALGHSLELAGRDFTPSPDIKKTVILISDGEETCGKDPIAVMQNLKAQGIDIKIHAIGFDASEAARAQLKKLADVSGGSYTEASNVGELEKSLEEAAQKEMLLVPQKEAKPNLLAASEGTRIVSSTKPGLAALIDGSEEAMKDAVWQGDNIVFSFKDGQAALIEALAVPVFETHQYNPSSLELWGSAATADEKAFFPLSKIEVKNQVMFQEVYQEFAFDPPVAVRHLKVVFGPGAGGSQSYPRELRAHGRYLTEDEFKEAQSRTGRQEMNVLAAANGGVFIAGARPEFAKLIDGTFDHPGESVVTYGNEEGIFGFRDNRTVVITKVAVPIFEASQYNVKTIEISGSKTSPTSGYEPLGTFETMNMVFAGNAYQEYVFAAPVPVRYIKVKLVDAHGGGYAKTHELQAFGKYE